MRQNLSVLGLAAVAAFGLATAANAQPITITIVKTGPSVAGTVTLELHTGTDGGCGAVEACPAAGAHVVATATVSHDGTTTAIQLAAALAAALPASVGATSAGSVLNVATPPPTTTHCCVAPSPEDAGSGNTLKVGCAVNNVCDGVGGNGTAAPSAGFIFSKPDSVPSLSEWGVIALMLLLLGGGVFMVSRRTF